MQKIISRPKASVFFGALVLLLLLLQGGCTRKSHSGLAPGDVAPDFNVVPIDHQTEKVSLSDFRGKVVLLNFWASWCGPCISELPALERAYARLKSEGFVVVAVGIDDHVSSLKDFKERYGLTFPVLFDANGQASFRYGVRGVPETFFIDRQGKIALFNDPLQGVLTARVSGPREWDSPAVISRLRELLKGNQAKEKS
ncbi:MAG: TlpA family protein disulfide reductase [Candidatus Dadabacteria bacterium]|nr:MAG: TlpA family protein disulfide reductase [Candidatus Dadabacteria bacterium]